MQKITPFLWFDGNVEQAVQFYQSVFPNAEILNTHWMDERIFTATLKLEGQEFIALDGGPMFKFNESVSFFILCKTQEEVDMYWEKLSAGGEKSRCGWLKDKFGLSWQVVPEALPELMGDPDKEKAGRVMNAMMKMDKIIIADLEKAYKGQVTGL